MASADGLRFLFIASHAGRAFVVDSRPFVAAIRVGPTFFAQTHLQPLEALNLPSTGIVLEARITAEAGDKGVAVRPTTVKQVTGPRQGQILGTRTRPRKTHPPRRKHRTPRGGFTD